MVFRKFREYIHFLLWILLLYTFNVNGQGKPISVLDTYKSEPVRWIKYSDYSNALYNQLAAFAEELLEERQNKVSQIETQEEWNKYIGELRKSFSKSLNGFKKTPLNATVTGTIEREDFTVEKIIYESLPGFYVTGCLMIPKIKKQNKLPAVIIPTGHSQAAFRRDVYQNSTLNLVKKGFIVFTYDPIGQGERVQYLDSSTNQSYIGGATFEHSYAGAQSLLIGNSISDYFIWDGVRAIDFLCSRPEVDTTRIGMTGVSGGGTQTAYVSAFDNRILAAAPECYITSYHRIFESIGPQDAEQNLYKGLLQGFEHVDLLAMRAPKPAMVISTTQDFFSIQGARETFHKAKEIYETLGCSANIRMIEADGVHGSTKINREEMYRFFQKELDLPGDYNDLEVDYFREEELIVTQTGQVATSYNSKTIYDFNKEKALASVSNRVVKNHKDLQQNKSEILSKAYKLSGYDSTRQIKSVVYTGNIEQEEYKIEKYFVQGKDFDYPIPFVLIKPYTHEKRPLLLYIDASGKDGLISNEQEIIKYLEKGYTILAPDLIGNGELENKAFKGDSYIQNYSFNILIAANLVGKSIAGIQASDLNLLFKHILTLEEIDTGDITSIVKDEACTSYLHFAVFNDKIKRTILVNPLISFEDLAITRDYHPKYLWTAVPEAIQHYDLNMLQALLPVQELVIINPVSAKGNVVSSEATEKSQAFLQEAYNVSDVKRNLRIIFAENNISDDEIFRVLEN
jgi:cephalosporin-C deacetylase-like acetyl esterase